MTELAIQASHQNPEPGLKPGLGMPEIRVSVEELLLWTAVVLCPFQDTILQKTPLNLPGASLSYLPLMALLLLAVVRQLFRNPFHVRRAVLLSVVYVGLVCISHAVSVNGANASLNWHMVVPLTILTALMCFVIFRLNFPNSRNLRVAIYLAFCFTIMGIACERIWGPNSIPLLQVTPNLSGRPSGFSTEASTLSVQIVASGMLTAHFLRARWQKYCVGILTFAMLVLSSSKGGLICLLLCALVLGAVRSRVSLLAKVMAVFVLTPLIYVGVLYVSSMFGAVIEANQTSTIATRLSMAAYALITVAHNPFGVGFTGFLPSIPKYLPQAMEFIQHLFPIPLAFVEVRGYLYPPQTDADCKTFFFDYVVYFGIPFAIAFFWFFRKLLKNLLASGYAWLFIGVLFSAMAMCTYYSTVNAWTLPILLGISLREVARHEALIRLY